MRFPSAEAQGGVLIQTQELGRRRRALHLRSVCRFSVDICRLSCHPWPCMSLKLRFVVDSIPSALTISFQ